MFHSSGSIYTRGNDKNHICNCKSFFFYLLKDGPYTCTRGRIDYFQAMIGKDPVLAGYRDNIGPNSRGHQIEIWDKNFNGKLPFNDPCLHQFKPNSAAAQFLIWIFTIFPFWVKHSYRIGNFRSRPVMIANNEIYIFLRSVCYFVYGFNATV